MESTGWREVVSSQSYQIFFPGQPLERQESEHRGGFSSWCRPTCPGQLCTTLTPVFLASQEL